jgi:hypothetical protein
MRRPCAATDVAVTSTVAPGRWSWQACSAFFGPRETRHAWCPHGFHHRPQAACHTTPPVPLFRQCLSAMVDPAFVELCSVAQSSPDGHFAPPWFGSLPTPAWRSQCQQLSRAHGKGGAKECQNAAASTGMRFLRLFSKQGWSAPSCEPSRGNAASFGFQ